MPIAQITDLTKKYGNKIVLNEVNFHVDPGEIVGLIGPNGSGKTTLLNIMMNMIRADSGKVVLTSKAGMSVSRRGFFSDMTVKENLLMYAKLYGAQENDVTQLMTSLQIDFGSEKFGKLSAGMKQKVSLAFSLLIPHKLILLDEPINHLDIDGIFRLREILLTLKASGTAFLVTSHVLSDLEKTCDRILFIKNGEIINSAGTKELIDIYGSLEKAYQSLVHGKSLSVI